MGPALQSGCGKAPVGADDPVRPPSPYPYTNNKEYDVPSAQQRCYPVGRGLRAPPENMHIVRRDTWVPPYRAGAVRHP